MLEHGGRLRRAAAHTGIPVGHWLDLSTGINPNGWPVPSIPREEWTRLPEDDDGLEHIAAAYYGAPAVLAVAGSQAAIQLLPHLRQTSCVGVISPGYAEHAHAWARAGHRVETLAAKELVNKGTKHDVVVLIHPNNPAGERFTRGELLALHQRLHDRGGWLIIDEAFMDATPECSIIDATTRAGLIVLRSPGKFFGLAGARAGFVAAAPELLARMREEQGPWTVAAPTRWVLRQALAARDWQQQTRVQLQQASTRLYNVLGDAGLPPSGGTALFQWVQTPGSAEIHRALAQKAILTRLFDAPSSLRFGLPADEHGWNRLTQGLRELPAALVQAST